MCDWMHAGVRPLHEEEEWQIVQGVEHILLAVVTTGMGGQHGRIGQNVDVEGIGADDEFTHGPVSGNRVAVGFKDDLTIRGKGRGGRDATGERLRW